MSFKNGTESARNCTARDYKHEEKNDKDKETRRKGEKE